MAEVKMEKSEKKPMLIEKNSLEEGSKQVAEAKEDKEENRKLTQVTKATVVEKKPGIFNRVVNAFAEEEVKDVKEYVVHDVIVPGLKNLFFDMVSSALSGMLFGDTRRKPGVMRSGRASYIDYNKPRGSYGGRSYGSYSDRPEYVRPNKSAVADFSGFVFESRNDAEDVLTVLVEAVETFGKVSVADLYDACGKTADYTKRGIGWTNLSTSRVVRDRHGYILDLPPVEAL